MKVLHVLHHSVPYLDGYSVRSKHIIDFQRGIGLQPCVVTAPQHETEVGRRQPAVPPEQIDGTIYHRTSFPWSTIDRQALELPFFREMTLMRALAGTLARVARQERVDVIHAHSPVLCGMPAARVAARLRLPFVYEVRGFWEDGFVERWRGGYRSYRYRLSRHLETRVFRRADAVVAISQHLLDDIAARGIGSTPLVKVRNGVDTSLFVPTPKDRDLAASHGVDDHPVVGFIGSFFRWEGLDVLLQAMAEVRATLPEARLMLVGGGEQEEDVRRWISELRLEDTVSTVGRVPHQDVLKYYSVMDVLVYPRHRSRVTTSVTPLKPLEAMAMGKAVIGSDVEGLSELLGNGTIGLQFEAGDHKALAAQIVRVLGDADLRKALGETGRAHVRREFAWSQIVSRYADLYRSLVRSKSASAP